MDESAFDRLTRSLGETRSRRAATALLGTLGALSVTALPETDARKKKKKKKKKPKKPKGGGTTQPPCTPQCSGCGGSDGCGGICGCGASAICQDGTCTPCTVTCSGSATACGAQLSQALETGGTILVCPGRFAGNFSVTANTTLIGAGAGDNPASATILDGQRAGRVLAVSNTFAMKNIRVENGLITGNPVQSGGGLSIGNVIATVTQCTFTKNTADWGGAIATKGQFTLENSVVTGNGDAVTTVYSGGIDAQGGVAKITNSQITNNVTRGSGGGISCVDTHLTITGTEISGNRAQEGGGLSVETGSVRLASSTRIVGNTATHGAGGISAPGAGYVTLLGATVSGNSDPQCSGVTGC